MNLFKKLFIILLVIVLIAGFIWFFIYYHNAKENNAEMQKSLSRISCVINDFKFEKSLADKMEEDPLNVRELAAYYDMSQSDVEYVASHSEEYAVCTLYCTVVNNSITDMNSADTEITDLKGRNYFLQNGSFGEEPITIKKGETFKTEMCLLIHRQNLNLKEMDALIRRAKIVVNYTRYDAFYRDSEDHEQVTFMIH
jgi:hypothetical protein